MSNPLDHLGDRLQKAVELFWRTRESNPQSVRAGKHLDGFRELVAEILMAAGLQRATIHWQQKTELPGWFRAEKNWDLLIVADGKVVAIIEFKSQVGSFGNNFNNRAEEALGNGTDLWAAYEAGAFSPSERPWLGYFMLLEDAPRSKEAVRVREPHFKVFEEFRDASYARRYELMLMKLVRSRLYDAGCLLLSPRESGAAGLYTEPNAELSFRTFITSLLGRAIAVAHLQSSDSSSP
ncbi:MAG: PaeR7I family type II restriction endonuclease [Cyanobacteria bacterium]|nr:PaeR7I family type II restriction endonuclease [Cyanobacteriota bacterium]